MPVVQSVGWDLWTSGTWHRGPCSGTAAVAPVSNRAPGAISQGHEPPGICPGRDDP